MATTVSRWRENLLTFSTFRSFEQAQGARISIPSSQGSLALMRSAEADGTFQYEKLVAIQLSALSGVVSISRPRLFTCTFQVVEAFGRPS